MSLIISETTTNKNLKRLLDNSIASTIGLFFALSISKITLSVRERDECSYAICLSHEGRVKHYRIDILPSGNFAIQDGPKFESIIAVSFHFFTFLLVLAFLLY